MSLGTETLYSDRKSTIILILQLGGMYLCISFIRYVESRPITLTMSNMGLTAEGTYNRTSQGTACDQVQVRQYIPGLYISQ